MARLNRILRTSVAAACIAAVGAPAIGAAPASPAPPARSPLEIKVGANGEFSRIEFHWAGGARAAHRREGQNLILRFNRNAVPDLSALRVFPPKGLKSVSSRTVGGALEVVLTLADQTDAKVGVADGATYVNLSDAPAAPAMSANAAAMAGRPNPVPDGGVVPMRAQIIGQQVALQLPWKAPLGAAVFRRGDTVWVVFDTRARIDLSKLPRGITLFSKIAQTIGPDYTILRITSPNTVPVRAAGGGGLWTLTFGEGASGGAASAVTVDRDSEAQQAGLAATVAGATRVLWLDDPVVGDRIAAVTALAPSKGLATRREFVDAVFLPSAQGLVVEPRASDLTVEADGDLVRLGRPKGLALSSVAVVAEAGATDTLDLPQPAAMPGVIDFEAWSKLGSQGFFARYDALQDAASAETLLDAQNTGKAAQVRARMALARFLIGSELSHEAIGVLNLLAETHQHMLGDQEFRALRGAARVMAGRYEEATADLSSPAIANESSTALWRGYVAAQTGQWKEARKAFSQGYGALNQIAPKWRARFARADAESGLATGDLAVARTQILMARSAGAGPEEDMATSLVQAKLYDAEGDRPRALAIYDALAKGPEGPLQSAAILRATQARLAMGQVTPVAAAQTFDGLRYRWRGDATELETIRALGQLYAGLGRYREALEAWRSAGRRLPDLPQAIDLQNDLANAFRSLFLDGRADGMEPVQSLALFFDFRELTPIGADGDLMVRKLARRLVDVDLLDQAASLLKYQTENRLDGVAKAQVATDLAMIYLMDRKPEQALQAINSSRTTVLPTALNTERRVLTARALIGLGRFDQAAEIVETDRSVEAEEVRGEIFWKERDWAAAGPVYEKRLGDRWKNATAPLGADEEARLLRAAIAYSLADDDASLARLSTRYGPLVGQSRRPDALRVALDGIEGARLSPADFSRVVADGDTFGGWVGRMKQKFREKPSPTGPAPRQAAAATPGAPAKG